MLKIHPTMTMGLYGTRGNFQFASPGPKGASANEGDSEVSIPEHMEIFVSEETVYGE
jgi:hypothetical protein